ncbi:MAG: type II toxin-antitoxin system VapC family toxin [Methylophilaceae bacterium]|nr:type II toxin-antitoxin system VapC family toxin [Methylophilaceae bacterium]
MAKYLLDTNICIYLTKQQHPALIQRFQALAEGEVAMSVITFGELQFGAHKSQHRKKVSEALEKLSLAIPVLEMNQEVSLHYGDIRAHLQHAGTPIGNNDLWIAAHARAQGLILVTNNVREFERVPGLSLENWVE